MHIQQAIKALRKHDETEIRLVAKRVFAQLKALDKEYKANIPIELAKKQKRKRLADEKAAQKVARIAEEKRRRELRMQKKIKAATEQRQEARANRNATDKAAVESHAELQQQRRAPVNKGKRKQVRGKRLRPLGNVAGSSSSSSGKRSLNHKEKGQHSSKSRSGVFGASGSSSAAAYGVAQAVLNADTDDEFYSTGDEDDSSSAASSSEESSDDEPGGFTVQCVLAKRKVDGPCQHTHLSTPLRVLEHVVGVPCVMCHATPSGASCAAHQYRVVPPFLFLTFDADIVLRIDGILTCA